MIDGKGKTHEELDEAKIKLLKGQKFIVFAPVASLTVGFLERGEV